MTTKSSADRKLAAVTEAIEKALDEAKQDLADVEESIVQLTEQSEALMRTQIILENLLEKAGKKSE